MDTLPAHIVGLSSEAARRLAAAGKGNRGSADRGRTLAAIGIENVFSVFNAILAAVIGFFLVFYVREGDARLLLDCLGVFAVAAVNTSIAVYQEIKAKRALDKVRLLLPREVAVVRDLRTVWLAPEEIVLGDVIRLARGDQAMVDGRLLASQHLEMDESLLTGESEPVSKKPGEAILSGSYCLSGGGYFEVTAVGDAVFAAGIARIARRFDFTPTPLTRRINALVQGLFVAAAALILLSLWRRGDAALDVDFVRRLGAILIALVPQGLVLLSSVTFALGVYRISRVGAVVQKLGAIESFAAATVICMDKTGTLTENRLAAKLVAPLVEAMSQDRAERLLGAFAALSLEQNATARALAIFPADPSATVLDEIPFSSARKMSCLRLRLDGHERVLALGGYDFLLERLSEADKRVASEVYERRGLSLLRALMLVELATDVDLALVRRGDFSARALCLVGIGDTVRQAAARVIDEFAARGTRFKILSGDAVPAVLAVCRELGWRTGEDEAICGEQLSRLSHDEFAAACREKTIFARLGPADKQRIVRELNRAGEHTVMLGDGVNDIAALKEAHLGLAMEEGSQAAKEVADIVLLANRFGLLPEILSEGNRIVNSVTAVAKLFLTKNFMVICATLLSLGFSLDFALTPRRVSLLNIFAIGAPALLIALRNANTRASSGFLREVAGFAAISALVMTACAFAAARLTLVLGAAGFGAGWKRFGGYLHEAAGGAGKIPDLASASAMAWLTTLVALSMVNFVLVAWQNESKRLAGEIGYAALLALGFTALCLWPGEGVILRAARLFYEIAPLGAPGWIGATLAGLSGALALVVLQGWFHQRKRINTTSASNRQG